VPDQLRIKIVGDCSGSGLTLLLVGAASMVLTHLLVCAGSFVSKTTLAGARMRSSVTSPGLGRML
jgi:hypothetical protein